MEGQQIMKKDVDYFYDDGAIRFAEQNGISRAAFERAMSSEDNTPPYVEFREAKPKPFRVYHREDLIPWINRQLSSAT